jgi:hypothetical protein
MSNAGVTYDECVAVLAIFREHEQSRLPEGLTAKTFNRRLARFDDQGRLYILVRFEPSMVSTDRQAAQAALGTSFSVPAGVSGPAETTFRIEYEQGPQAAPLSRLSSWQKMAAACHGAKDGQVASRLNTNETGTVGWCFKLNGYPVGLSNWHVLCARDGSSTAGDRVRLGTRDAALWHFHNLSNIEPNVLDFAIARFDQETAICGIVREDAEGFAVPRRLTENLMIGTDEPFRMAGNATISRDQRLEGVADVDYTADETRYRFHNQLVFQAGMARSGDSGSLAVRQSDNSATGLLFAAETNGVAYANPVCELFKGWTYVKSIKTTLGGYPEFEGDPPGAPAALVDSSSIARTRVGAPARQAQTHSVGPVLAAIPAFGCHRATPDPLPLPVL